MTSTPARQGTSTSLPLGWTCNECINHTELGRLLFRGVGFRTHKFLYLLVVHARSAKPSDSVPQCCIARTKASKISCFPRCSSPDKRCDVIGRVFFSVVTCSEALARFCRSTERFGKTPHDPSSVAFRAHDTLQSEPLFLQQQ